MLFLDSEHGALVKIIEERPTQDVGVGLPSWISEACQSLDTADSGVAMDSNGSEGAPSNDPCLPGQEGEMNRHWCNDVKKRRQKQKRNFSGISSLERFLCGVSMSAEICQRK
ncbi:hypothetical protein CEXT_46081 [Caerostris extrusa]|uniref:Uncharacterized protein n=1 Tax=Caerostris extrusa TaxID=172846 RepID=A0AAV4XCX5_CAEEX|nr:hypothetical protein CEXT_46081 [Caerostris extrusa]